MRFIFLSIIILVSSDYDNSANTFIKPIKLDTEIASGFGLRFHPILQYERQHNGVDYKVEIGTEVVASASGEIKYAGSKGTLGLIVIIDHGNGFESLYAHLSEVPEEISTGIEVKQGEVIALSGNSGLSAESHLHFELTKDGEYLNPAEYLN